MEQKTNKSFLIFTALAAIAAGVIAYLVYLDYLLEQNKLVLGKRDFANNQVFHRHIQQLNGQIKDLNTVIVSTKETLATTTAALADSEAKYNSTVNNLGQQVSAAQTRIGTLEKLSQTDPELLKKYSKVYF